MICILRIYIFMCITGKDEAWSCMQKHFSGSCHTMRWPNCPNPYISTIQLNSTLFTYCQITTTVASRREKLRLFKWFKYWPGCCTWIIWGSLHVFTRDVKIGHLYLTENTLYVWFFSLSLWLSQSCFTIKWCAVHLNWTHISEARGKMW